ncbi:MAG TPA: methyltransferase domain-containing protein [Candidatus Dormibacteraeota bacterium]|nr:methyltransferase domain-containing protein [Candidatus Dormibacteraeota bacterium]
MAHRHAQPRHPPVLRSLTDEPVARDNAVHYGADAARWYDAVNSWRTEDIPFYLREAQAWAGPGGAALELAAGNGRVTLPMARAGFRVTALESAPHMVAGLRDKLAMETVEVRHRVDVVPGDMRRFDLDRLYRFIYLPFNTMLMLTQPFERQKMLDRVREHLAPSGAFAFDIFTPDPAKLSDPPDWVTDLDFEVEVPERGTVRVRRERRSETDLARQVRHFWFRNRVDRGAEEVGGWDDELEIAMVFPRELELLLERQGFRIRTRHGGPEREAYAPTAANVQPMYVVAQLVP